MCPHHIEHLQKYVTRLAGYNDGVIERLKPVRRLVYFIGEFFCTFLEDGDQIRVGEKTLHCAKLYSMGWGKKFLFLYDTQGKKKPPEVPAISDDGFYDNNLDAPQILTPTKDDLQWIAANIGRILHQVAREMDRKGWAWQAFVRDFYQHLLIANPTLRRIHQRAEAHADQRWIESPDIANYVSQHWEKVDEYQYQEFADDLTSGEIYRQGDTWAVVLSYCRGTPHVMPLRSISIAFGTTEREMKDLMYGAIF